MWPDAALRRPARDIPRSTHGLWSLRELMHKFPVHRMAIALVTTQSFLSGTKEHDQSPLPPQIRSDVQTGGGLDRSLYLMTWNGPRATAEKIFSALTEENTTTGDLKKLFEELQGRILDEVKATVYFSLNTREVEFYENPRKGWETIINRFPNIGDDVEEASKCFALSRYSAAVFHSVQVVEAGLIELGVFLKVRDPLSGWTAVAGALKKVIDKKHQDRSRFEKSNFKFLEQIQGTVEGLKNAWRNKISHAHGKLTLMTTDFSPEVSEEIIFATRAFMRRLAEDLPTAKSRNR